MSFFSRKKQPQQQQQLSAAPSAPVQVAQSPSQALAQVASVVPLFVHSAFFSLLLTLVFQRTPCSLSKPSNSFSTQCSATITAPTSLRPTQPNPSPPYLSLVRSTPPSSPSNRHPKTWPSPAPISLSLPPLRSRASCRCQLKRRTLPLWWSRSRDRKERRLCSLLTQQHH
jgi:hypothetical protein